LHIVILNDVIQHCQEIKAGYSQSRIKRLFDNIIITFPKSISESGPAEEGEKTKRLEA